MEIEALYKLYSQTVLEPVPFEEFITGNKNKLRQAYQAGIVAAMSQLSLIDYFHKPKCDYDVGFQNGIKLAIGILVGKNVELVKPGTSSGEVIAEVEELVLDDIVVDEPGEPEKPAKKDSGKKGKKK